MKILYFAQIRELVGTPSEDLSLDTGIANVSGLIAWLRQRGANWETALAEGRQVLVAVNQTMARPETPVADGDEVALFPPVTGG